jgi:hypothetical protein
MTTSPAGVDWLWHRVAPVVCAIAMFIAPSRADAHPGIGIVRDSRGNLYYTDLKSVWKQTVDGRRSVVVAGVHTHELYLSPGDTLYGEHVWYNGTNEEWGHYVWRRLPSGVVDTLIPPRRGLLDDYDDFHFLHDETGATYWSDISADSNVIRKRVGRGAPVRMGSVPHGRPGWMTAASGFAYCVAAGVLYQFDARGTVRVLARDLSEDSAVPLMVRVVGFVTNRFRGPNLPDHDVGGVWRGRDGSVYVAVPGGKVVKRVSVGGAVDIVARSEGRWSAVNGLMLPDGDLVLLETGPGGAVRTRRIAR